MPKDRTPSPFSPWESILYGLIAIILLTTIAYALSGCKRPALPYKAVSTSQIQLVRPAVSAFGQWVVLPQAPADTTTKTFVLPLPRGGSATIRLRPPTTDSTGNLINGILSASVYQPPDTSKAIAATQFEWPESTKVEQVTPWWNWLIMSILTLFLLGLLLKSVFG